MGEDGPPGLPGITGVRVSGHGCVPHGGLLGQMTFMSISGSWRGRPFGSRHLRVFCCGPPSPA